MPDEGGRQVGPGTVIDASVLERFTRLEAGRTRMTILGAAADGE